MPATAHDRLAHLPWERAFPGAGAAIRVTGYRSDATAICVLGMHRGGTSALTGVVHELGAFLGPAAHLMARREDNPAGFFEHQLLTDLNDELLHELGGSWFEPPALEAGWAESPRLDGIRERARQRLHDDFADAPLWAWKDPRTSLTLPFWRPLLPETRFIVCVRHPLNVARSLLRRDGLDETLGVDLWMRHTVSALSALDTMPLFVLYDDLVSDPLREVARIAAALQLDVSQDAVARAQAHIAANSGLRHHQTTFAEGSATPATSFAAASLYAVLQRTARLQRADGLQPETLGELIEPFARMATGAHRSARDASQVTSRLAALDAHAATVASTLEAREAELARTRAEVGVLANELEALTSEHTRLGALLVEREADAAERLSARGREFEAQLREREAEATATLNASRAEIAALRSAHEAEQEALRAAHVDELAVVRSDYATEIAALCSTRDTEIATLRSRHDTEIATLRSTHDAEIAALGSAHHAEMGVLRAAGDAGIVALRADHDAELSKERSAHGAERADWQARAAADAATIADLRAALHESRDTLGAAEVELGRLNTLLLYLQTPTGLAKLALRAALPSGLHQWLRARW